MGDTPKTFETLTRDMPDLESTALASAEPIGRLVMTWEDGVLAYLNKDGNSRAEIDPEWLAEHDEKVRADERAAFLARLRKLQESARYTEDWSVALAIDAAIEEMEADR